MPVGKSLSKIQKKVEKTGKSASLHPQSLKLKQLNRATLRKEKISKQKATRDSLKDDKNLRIHFFKDAVNLDDKKTYDLEEMKQFINAFISRDDNELEKLKSDRRPGRPASSRQDLLENRIRQEKKEFHSGFKMPNLSDKKTVEHLKNWSGDHSGLSIMKFIRVTNEMTELPEEPLQDHEMAE